MREKHFATSALIAALILSGCAGGKRYEIRFMPPPAFLGEGNYLAKLFAAVSTVAPTLGQPGR